MSSEIDEELLELINTDKPRKRARDASGKPKPAKKRRTSNDSENDVESEDGGGEDENLYPLEGKYIDEADREELLGKTEIEREEILAARMDEVERIRDRKRINELRAQQLAGVNAVESEARRTARATGKDRDKTKDRSLNALKAKRKAKDEKKRLRGDSPRNDRSASPEDMDMSDSESEAGQVRRGRSNDGTPPPPPPEEPLTSEMLQKVAVTRNDLAKYCSSPFLDKIVSGGWVRYLIGETTAGERKYRICQIKSVVPTNKPYLINGRTAHDVFELKHGQAVKEWQMDRTSNDPWTQEEYRRLTDTYMSEKESLPSKKEVDELVAEMAKWKTKQATEDDISAMIARRRKAAADANGGDGTHTPLGVAERSRLIAQRTLALRRQDMDEVAAIDAQLAKLPSESMGAKDGGDDRLAKVNERNRKANMEAVRRAEIAEAERKRKERLALRAGGTGAGAVETKKFDPSARLRTVPRLFESNSANSTRPSTPNPGAAQKDATAQGPPAAAVAAATLAVAPKPLRAGKSFEAAVIESIEVDLGDF